ncbi:MAG: peptidoglycan DD-metalloendopeptidase family protein [Deltaproteobacteria bacterium]|nr:peptidoglycan DD-metalloendopeptidase family protein [Deltaproteobacteria bacterium]
MPPFKKAELVLENYNLMNDINSQNPVENSNRPNQPITDLSVTGKAVLVSTETTQIPGLTRKHKAIFLSGILMATLMGLIIGMFAASKPTNASRHKAGDDSWLNTEVPPEDNNSKTAEYSNSAADTSADIDSAAPEADNNMVDISPAPSAPDTGAGDDSTHHGVVKKGVPVIKNLMSIGLSMGDAQLIINSLDGIFDFRRARPGQTFSVHFNNASDRVDTFTYEVSPTEIYKVTRSSDTFTGKKLNIITDKTNRVFSGTITTSLFGTMQDLGAKPALAAKVADILSKQVNFLKEQRPGDTFKVIVEEESLDGEFQNYGPVLALEYNGIKAGKKRLYYFEDNKSTPTYYDDNLVSLPHSALTIPLYYSHLSSPFGWRIHPILKTKKLHNGTDFSAPTGTPVWSCTEGTIIFAEQKGPNGNLVGIDHGNGLSSYYAHLHRIEKGIKKGVKVRRKQVIGYVGSTGRSTGPHLHWGIKLNGKFVDPLKFKIIPGQKISAKNRTALKSTIDKWNALLDKTKVTPPKGEIDKVSESDEPLSDY